MLKLILFSIGFVLIFEGILYFSLSNKINYIIDILKSLKAEKIRFFSSLLIIIGLSFVYFTLKMN